MTTTRTSSGPNAFYQVLAGVALLSAATYILVASPASALLLRAELVLIKLAARIVGLASIEVGPNAILIYKQGLRAITLILTVECLGVYAALVYTLLILLTPGVNPEGKARGLLLGDGILFLANIVRIATAAVVGVYTGTTGFRVFHDTLGGALMLLLAAILWIDWLYHEAGERLGWARGES